MNEEEYILNVHSPSDNIDFSQFIRGEKQSTIFDFYSISRVLRVALTFCGFIVAAYTKDGKLIGYTYVFKGEKQNTYFFSYIWVDNNYRYKGLGKNLHKRAIEEAKKRGGQKLLATCSPENYESLSLLFNFNWMICDFKENFYGKNEHRFILENNLTCDDLEKLPVDEQFADLKEINTIKKLLNNGYKGVKLEIFNNEAKILFQKININKELGEKEIKNLEIIYQFDRKSGLLKVSIYPERVFYLTIPFKNISQDYIEFLSAILSFATACNIHNFNGKILIKSSFSIPGVFKDVISLYNKVQRNREVRFRNVDESIERVVIDTSRPVEHIVLFSGGKDSTYALLKLLEKYDKNSVVALYFKGPSINTEYLVEYENVCKLAKKFGVKLQTIEIFHGDYGYNSLRTRSRGQWRGILLLTLAALYSKNIYWGVTLDSALHGSVKDFLNADYSWIYFGDSLPVINTLTRLLDININLLPSEFEVYKSMFENYTDVLAETHSCFNPLGKCNLENNWERACLKCKTLHIYEKLINKEQLSQHEIEFVKSPLWHGDPDILDIIETIIEEREI